jgi:hypothetical protein
MNVFRSLDDELDGNGKAGSHWWIIPFMVTVCFLWGVLGFLSGGTDRKTPTRTDAIAAGLTAAPEAPPLQSAVGIAPTLQSGSSPAQAGVVTHSVAALRSATAESAEESQVLTESSTLPPMERAGLWPPNDPDFKNCLRNGNGVRLQWQSTRRAKPIYLMVMQRHDGGGWETRVEKTRVSGVAFALALRSAQARNSEFQWVLLQSQSNIPPESNYFCTRG